MENWNMPQKVYKIWNMPVNDRENKYLPNIIPTLSNSTLFAMKLLLPLLEWERNRERELKREARLLDRNCTLIRQFYFPEKEKHKTGKKCIFFFLILFFCFFFLYCFYLAILQRSSVDVGRIRIQGVATCLYLCMDACGSVYGSVSFFSHFFLIFFFFWQR